MFTGFFSPRGTGGGNRGVGTHPLLLCILFTLLSASIRAQPHAADPNAGHFPIPELQRILAESLDASDGAERWTSDSDGRHETTGVGATARDRPPEFSPRSLTSGAASIAFEERLRERIVARVYRSGAPPLAQRPSASGANSGSSDRWEFSVTPDLWAAGLEGDITVKGTTSDLDVGFSDLLDDLDYGGALHIEGRKGKWSVLGDVLFLKLSGSESGNVTLGPLLDRQIGPIDLSGPGVSIEADVEVEVTQALVELGLGYSVLERPLGAGDSDRSLRLDVIGGARYWYLKTELDVDISASLGPLSETASFNLEGSKDWIDPFVGARVQADLTEKLFVRLRGDVGGFGVGSDFTWKAAGLFHYQKSPRLSFYAGYQALDVDYEDGSGANKFALDATMHGPVLGFALHFGGRRGEATDRL